MSQPILYQITAWDCIYDKNIAFTYTGNQVLKNQLTIRNNLTNEIVYDQIQTSFQLKHVVPTNSLSNGICYNARVRVFDKNDIPSPYGNTEIFYCFSSPIFIFNNCIENQIIGNSSFEAFLTYTQSENEPLNNYQFILYDEHQLEISRSGTLYNLANLKYIYANLDNKGKYYFRAMGETLNHMIVDTGMLTVSVQYILPSVYAMVDLQNLAKEGLIRVRSNIVSILGKSNPDPPIYIDNKEVDLSLDGSWVKFDEGFEINGDFTLQLKVRDILLNAIPLTLSNGTDIITIKYMQGKFASQTKKKGYFILRASNGITNYVQMSNYVDLPIEDIDRLYLFVRRINFTYEIKAANLDPRIHYLFLNNDFNLDGSYILSAIQPKRSDTYGFLG